MYIDLNILIVVDMIKYLIKFITLKSTTAIDVNYKYNNNQHE